jgi:prepilin-type N-terminal cleavage/methylation domain-containing protein
MRLTMPSHRTPMLDRTGLPLREPAPRRPSGFTFIEILTVFIVFGIVTAFAMPHLRGYRDKAQLRSAREHVTSYLTLARAAAIRRGRAATFTVTANNDVSVTLDSSGVQLTLAQPFAMGKVYGVTLPGGATSVTFDRRGFATSLASTASLVVSNIAGRDSVCVTRLGVIMPSRCTP